MLRTLTPQTDRQPKTKRQPLFDMAAVVVQKALRNGKTISIETETARLLARHPDSGMTHEEVRDAFRMMAVNEHATVVFD